MQGFFITMEGPDGSGKSTQIELLKKHLEKRGFEIVITREPGGTNISEAIRNIILNKEYLEMGHITELLLYASARAQLVSEIIIPALNKNKIVISDRFIDSSVVYQGIGRNLGIETVYTINNFAVQGLMPDVTIHLDLSGKEGIKRKKKQTDLDRLEMEKIDFHERVANGYKTIAKLYPDRIYSIDATLQEQVIHDRIVKRVTELLR